MAVTLDKTLGTHAQAASATNVLSTTNAVASGAHILVVVGWFHNGNSTSAMSGGSLTWTKDVELRSGSIHIAIHRAPVPLGLTSGTNLTATYTGAGTPDSMIGAGSFLGIDTSGTVIATQTSNGTGTGWSSGSVASTNGNMLIGGSFCDGLVGTSTPTSPAVELFDFNNAGQNESETAAYKLSVAGTDSADGTWSGSVTWIGAGVCYKAAAGAAATSLPVLPFVQTSPLYTR